jgi:L-threonylcarbamoyladenylate synthase
MITLPLDAFLSGNGLSETIVCLRGGGLIVFPSDTVYGMLVDAKNPDAVRKLLAFKERPPGKAVSVFVRDINEIGTLCVLPEEKRPLLERLLPGPFTMVLASRHVLRPELESETGTLGVRIPDFLPVNTLVREFGGPITATSANLAGRNPHYSVESFLKDLPKSKAQLVDLIVDAGKLPRNKPSTVVDLTSPEPTLLRKGDLVIERSVTSHSRSPEETAELAVNTLNALMKGHPEKIVFILKGDLGAGKTQFSKALAARLGIHDVVSPTFVVSYEYDIPDNRRYTKFHHFDLYNIQDESEFEHLGLEQIDRPGTIASVEWGEKLGDAFELFRRNAEVVLVELVHAGENERDITIHYLS